ncbi:hypothetical protein C1H46_008885 [Malus baccata]|uniref:Uncharacterized protein n=1 Tax=Malus baccata TaxID=106549 RepID=A0A540N4M9_MALBA|nr:hypothetical protein C1H46_008885 [Malus baccata]
MESVAKVKLSCESLATKVLAGCGFDRVKNIGGAANAAIAWNPSSIAASVNSHEQSLRWCANLSLHNVSGALNDMPAGSDWNNRFCGDEAGQKLEPGLVFGLHLEDTLLQ